jgi:hypothetical protein
MSDPREGGINWMLDQYRKALEQSYSAKILWGNRAIYKKDWIILKKFLNAFSVKTVIEYGVGLSTELMVLEGIEVVSLETLDWWADICRKVIGNEIITYQEGHPPDVGGRRFDLAFVDGPQTRRKETIEHAKQHSEFVYLHDPERKEEVAQMEDWVHLDFTPGYDNHFFFKPKGKS